MARIKVMWLAIQFIEINHELGRIVACPWCAHQSARDWLHRTVGIAIFPYQSRFHGVLPSDVDNSN